MFECSIRITDLILFHFQVAELTLGKLFDCHSSFSFITLNFSQDLASLKNGCETENWYDWTGMTPIGEWGSLRLRIRYMDDLGKIPKLATSTCTVIFNLFYQTVMPAEEYSPLQELLLENEFHSGTH